MKPNPDSGITIDPDRNFGRPTIAGTRISTAVVAERFMAGESVRALARDYAVKPSQIEVALRYEMTVNKRKRKRKDSWFDAAVVLMHKMEPAHDKPKGAILRAVFLAKEASDD